MTLRTAGMALLTTLMVGAVLAILALALVGLFLNDYQTAARQQRSIQAYWNARSGIEAYLQSGKLPSDGAFRWGKTDRCQVQADTSGNVIFTGQSGNVQHRITLLGGDPSRINELRP